MDTTILEELKFHAKGHVIIKDKDSGEILQDVWNSIHPENLSQAIAMSLSDRTNGHIYQMVFGNGGSTESAVGTLDYLSPNTSGSTAQLI